MLLAMVLTALAVAGAPLPLSTDGTDPKTWDMSRDGLLVAPGNHRAIYESKSLRADTVIIPVGTEEPPHLHPYYSVLVIDSPNLVGGDRDINGKRAPAANIDSLLEPIVNITPPQAIHSLKNGGVKDGHLIRIEFKSGPVPTRIERAWTDGQMPVSSDGTAPAGWPKAMDGPVAAAAMHKVVFKNADVRVQSVTIPAGAQEPFHVDLYPSVFVVDSGAQSVDRTRAGKTAPAFGAAPVVRLREPQAAHAIRNTGKTPLHYIQVEFLDGFKHAPPGFPPAP